MRWVGGLVAFSVGYRVETDKWEKSTQRCRNSTTHGKHKIQSNIINREIQRFAVAVDSVFDSFEKQDKCPNPAEFRLAFNHAIGKESRISRISSDASLYSAFDHFVSSMSSQNAWTDATVTKFGAIKKHLQAFDPELSFASLSDLKLHSYVQHLHKEKLRNTTIAKNISFVRWFIRWCYNNDLYFGKVHDTFRPKLKGTDGNSKEVVHLSWDELMKLSYFLFPYSKQYLARVRDVFCFCCFTGLRYSDVFKLSRSNVREDCILLVTVKTSDALKIELNQYSRAILDNYINFHFPKDKALPVISNAKMNEYLKELGEYVGLDEPQRDVYFMGNVRHEDVMPKYSILTTHCGRRTFIVNAIFLGIPIEVVMKFTGHSDYKAMKPYIKIVDELKAQEMNKFNRL
ncbi:MAG: site-specific integrase [Bacteroidia bacterium]|nr:site-specific integrase [Bacteroidia bacterium]